MVRERIFSSYDPRRGRDLNSDRRKLVSFQLGTVSASFSNAKPVFRSPGPVKITRVSLACDSAVAGLNESYWTFALTNDTQGGLSLFANNPTTQDVGTGAKGDISADTEYDLGVDQNQFLKENDVLSLNVTKTGSAPDLTRAVLTLEYEVEEGPVPAIVVTTTSTSTSTTTTTTVSTSSTTTVTTTSSSTTTTSSSTTTTSSSTTTTSSSTSTTTTTTTTITTSTTTT